MNFRKETVAGNIGIDEHAYIHQEQVSIAFNQIFGSVLALFLGSIFVVYFFQNSFYTYEIFGWFTAVSVTLLYRLMILKSFQENPKRHDTVVWQYKFILGMYVSAFLWGSTAFLLFHSSTLSHQLVLIFMISGIGAVSSGTLASLPNVAKTFLSILLLPLFLVVMFQDGIGFKIMGLLVFIFYVLLVNASKRINVNIMESLRSKVLFEKATNALALSNEYSETIFREAPAGIFYYDTDLIIIDSNAEMMDILAISKEKMIGLEMEHLPDKSLDEALRAPLSGVKGYYEGPYKTMVNKLDLWITLKTSPMHDAARNIIGGVAIVTDISDRIRTEQKMKHQAYFDALTDIPNRILLKDRIVQALANYHRHRSIIAVLFLDLDHFKSVNDSMGHHIGDALLVETAKRLQRVCREGDTVSRIGGDEFVILLCELGEEPHSAASKAEIVAQKIHDALAEPFDIGLNEPITTSSSIGISLVSSNEQSADDLLKYSDTAMYQAKKEGRSTTRFYQEQMDQWIKKRLIMENALRHALKNNELEVYYQPVIEIETKKIIGAEALLRWNHPQMGIVLPDEIISIAEESGLIIPIGNWVMREACTQFVKWKQNSLQTDALSRIAINVSAIQFRHNDFVDQVIDIIKESGIEPSMVEIELTESLIIDKIDLVIEKMKHLREVGIGISMDDFGTGYSSLAYLKRLPFTTLKIDRSFVRDIMSDKDDAVLVETILSMASIFNLDVIAEGVETVEQYEFLKGHKCQYFQGYLCSKPLQVNGFEALLEVDIQQCSTRYES